MTQTSSSNYRQASCALAFLLILVLGAALRITAARTTVVDTPIRADAKGYVAYAYNWNNYGVFSRQTTWIPSEAPTRVVPDALQQPGYPAFLRLFLRGLPDDSFVHSVMFGQACLGIATVVLSFVLARMVLGSMAALLVMLLVALSPHLIVMENYLLCETLYTFLLVIFMVAGTATIRQNENSKKLMLSGVTGLILGLACLVRPPLMQFAPLVFILTLVISNLRIYRTQALCGLLGFVLILAPWIIRNLIEFGQIGDPSLLVNTLIHGSYPNMQYNGDPNTLGYAYRFDPHIAEISKNVSVALAAIGRKFLQDPIAYANWYLIGKIAYFFKWQIVGGYTDVFTYPVLHSPYFGNVAFLVTHALMLGLHWPLVIASLFGAITAWTRQANMVVSGWRLKTIRWFSMILGIVLLGNMIGAPYSRYSIPFRPLLYILATFALLLVVNWVQILRREGLRA